MIDKHRAVLIAEDATGERVVGIALAKDGYVVGFQGPDPYNNLPVFIDARTGEFKALSASEYIQMMDTLRPIVLEG
jgi:hypothetical protein